MAAPSTSVSIQDLVDTLRTLEQYIVNLDDKHIIDAYGKISLGGISYTSVTLVLRNALLAFEARPPPTWVLCKVTGGNLVAKDENGLIIDDPRMPTAYVSCDRASSTDGSILEGSGVTPAEVADAVWNESAADHTIPGSTGRQSKDTYDTAIDTYNLLADVSDFVNDLHDEALGKWVLNSKTSELTLYRLDGSVMQVFNLKVAVGDVPPYVERSPV